MEAKASKALKYTLSFILAALFVWFAFRKVDWQAFMEGLSQTRWIWIPAFFAASVGALIFRALRWKMLLKPLDAEAKASRLWDAGNVGNLANAVLPGTGEFVRCGYVSGRCGYDKALGTAVMERLWDFLAIGLLFVLALLLGKDRFGTFFQEQIMEPLASRSEISLWWVAVIVLAAISAGIRIIFRFKNSNRLCGKIAGVASGLWHGMGSVSKMERKWAFALCTAGIWFMYVLMCWCILKAVPALDALDFVDALFISAVGNIASVIPVPGGMGAYHYLVALTLSTIYGASWDTGVLFATLNHELHLLLVIVLGAISYAILTLKSSRKREIPPE